MRSLLISSLLIAFILVSTGTVRSQDGVSATWEVQKYDINVSQPAAGARVIPIVATLLLRNVSPRPAGTLTLRIASNAEITSIKANGSDVSFTKGQEKLGSGSLQLAIVRLPAAVAANASMPVEVTYRLEIKDNSGTAELSPNAIQLLPASFWYPTPNSWFFAKGPDLAPTRIQFQAGDLKLVGPGIGAGSAAPDAKILTQPFLLAGRWQPVESRGLQVLVPAGATPGEVKRAEELAALAADAKAFIGASTGRDTDGPIRLVAVHRGGGFSNGGVILFDQAVLRRPKIDSGALMNIVDGVAKISFGNVIAVSGEGFGVVREGLTRHLANRFIETKFGTDVADVERLRQRASYAAVAERDSPLSRISSLDDHYYTSTANKGAMIWRLLERRAGIDAFWSGVKSQLPDGNYSLTELRESNSANKDLVNELLDSVTGINMMAGIPLQEGANWKVALRNTGPVDVTVNVEALLANGQKMTAPVTLKATSFGEVVFKTDQKVVRVEIDPEKYYPQTDYSDDVAPREFNENDLLLAVKKAFDKQEYANAEKLARSVLREYPRYDDVRTLLARALLAQDRSAEAEKEFKAVLEEKLPTARSMAWANLGLADIAARGSRPTDAVRYATEAINVDGEYGASLAARMLRQKAGGAAAGDESVKAFFAQFDKTAVSNKKPEMEAMTVPGELSKFVGGVAGSTVQWTTDVRGIDRIDADTVLVETNTSIKLLNQEPASGVAVYRLQKIGGSWKLAAVEIFEVR